MSAEDQNTLAYQLSPPVHNTFIWARVELNDALRVLSTFSDYLYLGGFDRPWFPHSWQRFFLYSNHVRHLECYDIKYIAFTQAVLRQPPRTDLFSKLVVLDWQGEAERLDCLTPLLSPTLRTLFITFDDVNEDDPDTVDVLCKTIALRSPRLRTFEINFPSMDDNDVNLEISQWLCELISLLLDLISISIPIYFMIPKTFTTLSRLRRLEDILLSDFLSRDYVENHAGKAMKADERSEEFSPFPSLYCLIVNDDLDTQNFTIAKAFGQGIQLFALEDLSCSPCCETSDEVIALMESVNGICPNLRSIFISGENCPSPRLPWQAIEALLRCPDLDSLEVSKCTVDMELENIITVATDRFFWNTIALPSTEPINYQALVAFAKNCPYLVELRLRLSTASEFPVPPPNVWFSSLNTLDVGDSSVASCIDAGIFLSAICVEPLKIVTTDTHAQAWADIERMVNSVVGTARVRMLNREITSLRDSRIREVRVVLKKTNCTANAERVECLNSARFIPSLPNRTH